jgi:hypothetical protein
MHSSGQGFRIIRGDFRTVLACDWNLAGRSATPYDPDYYVSRITPTPARGVRLYIGTMNGPLNLQPAASDGRVVPSAGTLMKVKVVGVRRSGHDLFSAVLAPVSALGPIARFHPVNVDGTFDWWNENPQLRGTIESVMGEALEMVVVGSMETAASSNDSSSDEEWLGGNDAYANLRYRSGGLLEVYLSVHMLMFCITPVMTYLDPNTRDKMVIFSTLQIPEGFLVAHNSPGRVKELLRFDEDGAGLVATRAHPRTTVAGALDIFDHVAAHTFALRKIVRVPEHTAEAADLHHENMGGDPFWPNDRGGPDNPFVFD